MSGKVAVSEVKITSFGNSRYGGFVTFSASSNNLKFDYVYKFSNSSSVDEAIANGAMHMKQEMSQLSNLIDKMQNSPERQAISRS